MKKSLSRYLFLALPLCLTACGYSIKELYNDGDYNSPIYKENYYTHWDNELVSAKSQNPIGTRLDKENDWVFLSHNDDNFKNCEPHYADYVYVDRYTVTDDNVSYGDANKLSLVDESFKHGYVSKLFDGQLFCDGYYQKARVQINEEGFAAKFEKSLLNSTYFAMSFKASSDYVTYDFVSCESVIDLHVSFYVPNGANSYNRMTFSYEITNDHENYELFGFKIPQNITEFACGISVTYDIKSFNATYRTKKEDGSYETHPLTLDDIDRKTEHSLLLYEILLPHSNWN